MSHIAAGRSAPWTELYKSQQGGAKVGTAAFEAVLMAHLLDMGLMCFQAASCAWDLGVWGLILSRCTGIGLKIRYGPSQPKLAKISAVQFGQNTCTVFVVNRYVPPVFRGYGTRFITMIKAMHGSSENGQREAIKQLIGKQSYYIITLQFYLCIFFESVLRKIII